MWIEIFKSGSHTDSQGKQTNYSNEDISFIAEKYNQAVANDTALEAPVVIGHPRDNSPAYGWVERLARRGEKLLARLKNLSPELIDAVQNGSFRKVSISLYPDMMLRHIGLLGGAAPSVKGLKNVSFSDAESSELISDFHFTDLNDKEGTKDSDLIEKNNSLVAENQMLLKKLDEKDRIIRKLIKDAKVNEFKEFIKSEINEQTGLKLTPAQSQTIVEIMEMIYERTMKKINGEDDSFYDFSENEDLIEKIKSFIKGLPALFNTDEFAVKQSKRDSRENFSFSGKKVLPDRLLLHNRAIEIMNENPTLSYEEAIIEAQS